MYAFKDIYDPTNAFMRTLRWLNETVYSDSLVSSDGTHLASYYIYDGFPDFDERLAAMVAQTEGFIRIMSILATPKGKAAALHILHAHRMASFGICGIRQATPQDFMPNMQKDVASALLAFKQVPMQELTTSRPHYAVAILPSGRIRCVNEPGMKGEVFNRWPA